MRTRHRQPVVFTLYMMDVFCCALGCVTLLWLLGMRQTKQKADEFGAARRGLRAFASPAAEIEAKALTGYGRPKQREADMAKTAKVSVTVADGTGKGRLQILDRDWVVIAQSPAPGTKPDLLTRVVLTAVKYGEPTGRSGCAS